MDHSKTLELSGEEKVKQPWIKENGFKDGGNADSVANALECCPGKAGPALAESMGPPMPGMQLRMGASRGKSC